MRIVTRSIPLLALALFASAPALADDETEAVIVAHTGNNVVARTRQGDITVVLSNSTEIRESSGLKKKTAGASSLIPGLIIEVEGTHEGSTIHATKVTYKEKDWRAAIASKAGTQEQFASQQAQLKELRQAIIDGQEYVIQDETKVLFASGKTAIAPEYQAALKALAAKAPSFGNYRISILGFADPRGDAAANERLSAKRALAVSNYLRQTGHIQPGRVLSPSAMGEGTNAPEEAAPTSDAEARRVLVRVVTPKGQLKN